MRNCALVICLTVSFASSVFGQVDPIKPPPLPDFKTPVDYTAWYFNEFAKESDSSALPLYEPILFGPSAQSLKLDAKGDALKQMMAVLSNPQEWRTAENPELTAWINRLESKYKNPFMEAASKKDMPVRRLKTLKFLYDRPISRFVNGRAIGQMMLARGWRIDGNVIKTEYLIDAAQSNLAFADHLGRLPSLEEQFFSAGHRNTVYTQIATALRSFMHRIHVWDEIMAAFDRFDSVPVTELFARSLYFAEASALQQLQHFCMTKPVTGDNAKPTIDQDVVNEFYSAASRKRKRMPPGCEKLASADPVILAKAIHEYYEQMRQLLRKPFVANLKDELARIEKKHWEGIDGMKCLVPRIGFAVQTSFRSETLRRGVRLYLERSMHYKRTGLWPRTLDEMTHPSIKLCRIDPYTGKDFLMRHGVDGEVVYSVGINGVDDKSNQKKDVVIAAMVYTEKQGVVADDIKENIAKAKESQKKEDGTNTDPDGTTPKEQKPPQPNSP